MNKKILASLLTLGVLVSLSGYGVRVALADEDEPNLNIVSGIAQRFNLKESDVQAVLQAVRDERQDDIRKRREQRLSEAVKAGVITETQKNIILQKIGEHRSGWHADKNEIKKWFKKEGIDFEKLRSYLRLNHHRIYALRD